MKTIGGAPEPDAGKSLAGAQKLVVSLDVGGSSVKAGLVDIDHALVSDAIRTYPMDSHGSAEAIIGQLMEILYDQSRRPDADGACFRGIAFGFPGPFDYEKGISYMQGIDKYDSLYGVDLRRIIRGRIRETGILTPQCDEFDVLFTNDATAYAFGEYLAGTCKDSRMALFLTLGTGCGSTFLRDGAKVQELFGKARTGWIFNQFYRDGIVDDFISRRGLFHLAQQHRIDMTGRDVKDLADLAYAGDLAAREVFAEYGGMLGEIIDTYTDAFDIPVDLVVLGGNISRSYSLFSETMHTRISHKDILVKVSTNLSRSALIGAASLFQTDSK
ncbi:MAG: ROK family protein [Saccharofermentanales bacterium]